MPRRNKNAGKFDFAIHEDPPSPSALMDEASDIQDFADKLSLSGEAVEQQQHDGGEDIPVDATDSSLTKASTLVNDKEDNPKVEESSSMPGKEGTELTIDSMLEELEDGKKLDEDEERSEASVSRRESLLSETTHETHENETEHSSSRRASTMTDGTYGHETDGSYSRRESTLSNGTFDDATEDSMSRRQSGISTGTYDSTRHESEYTGPGDESILDNETEDASFVDDHTDLSESRRESAVSAASTDNQRRASARTEALIHAAARDIVEQINSGHDHSALLGQSAEEEDGSQASFSKQSSARPSEVHESFVEEDALDGEDKQSSARQSDVHESAVDENAVADEEDKKSSARPSEAHESLVRQEEDEDDANKQPSARPSEVHESFMEEDAGVDEEGKQHEEGKQSSARTSEAHESPGHEDEGLEEKDKQSSARPSEVHESLVHEDEEAHEENQQSSARPSDAHETLAGEDNAGAEEDKQPSARPSEAHESLVQEEVPVHEEDQLASGRPSEANESVIHNEVGYEEEDVIRESVEVDEMHQAEEEDDEQHAPSVGEGGDSSSHNDNDDDVFSDHSPRSSVGSMSEAEQRKMSDNVTQRTRTPRISDFSHYETEQEEDFVPTIRGAPRPPFRSPSSVKAMQMSSPPPSVLGSSRSSRRTPRQTVSRMGSPSASAQYSPKNMKTPPRFKRNTPPLVLLHATLLPLRWPWGDVLDSCHSDELSEGGHAVREAWRLLTDRLGDTVCERGILLPHPQNDFEVLEERLLEALELPLRRRARILECGHYLGPSNEMTLLEEEDEFEYAHEDSRTSRGSLANKTHWCGTCCSEIKFDSLGAEKVFRVKVYASNGLVRAGAWEACWKEMERVDVEFEPIVESDVHEELVRLDAEQQRALELQQEDEHHDYQDEMLAEPEPSYLDDEPTEIHHMPSTPVPEPRVASVSPSPPSEDERWVRDEERLREIYGQTPPSRAESARAAHTQEPMAAPSSTESHAPPPSSPPQEYAQQEERRSVPKDASLPELILEAFRVMMQDKKNVMIMLMSALVLLLALRGGSSTPHDPATFQTVVKGHESSTVTVTERETPVQELIQETVQAVSSATEAAVASESVVEEVSASSVEEEPTSSVVEEEVIESVVDEEPASPMESVEEELASSVSEETASATDEEIASSEDEATAASIEEETASVDEVTSSSADEATASPVDESTESSETTDPCASVSGSAGAGYQPVREGPETVVSERIVKVVETVTEKVIETTTATITEARVDEPRATEEAAEEAEQALEIETESMIVDQADEPVESALAEEVEEVKEPVESVVTEEVDDASRLEDEEQQGSGELEIEQQELDVEEEL